MPTEQYQLGYEEGYQEGWNAAAEGIALSAAPVEPTQELQRMTAGRAAYFMERFLREEKLLGPNEQAAVQFALNMLEAAPQQDTALIRQMLEALETSGVYPPSSQEAITAARKRLEN